MFVLLHDNLQSNTPYPRIDIHQIGFLSHIYLSSKPLISDDDLSDESNEVLDITDISAELSLCSSIIWQTEPITEKILNLMSDKKVYGKTWYDLKISPFHKDQYQACYINIQFNTSCNQAICMYARFNVINPPLRIYNWLLPSYFQYYQKYVNIEKPCKLRLLVNHKCPVLFLYITNINNRELHNNIVDKISLSFNKHETSSETVLNPNMKNMYTILPSEQLNYSIDNTIYFPFYRIENSELLITFKSNAKLRYVNIYLIYKSLNWLTDRLNNNIYHLKYRSDDNDKPIDPYIEGYNDIKECEAGLTNWNKQLYSNIINEVQYLST